MDNNNFYTFQKYIKENNLTISEEDYLEMIYRLSLIDGYTRVKELSSSINVKPPSVTSMLKKLTLKNLIIHKSYGIIELTNKGKELGKIFLDRHESIEQFLILINTKENILEETEKIEHTLSPDTIYNIKQLVSFFHNHIDILETYKDFQNNN